MIAPGTVTQIRRLLEEGTLSHRKIAERAGVSRGTVHAIASGKRPDYAPRRRNEREHFVPPDGPLRRCPTCGGLVQMPCLLCQLRSMHARQRASRYDGR